MSLCYLVAIVLCCVFLVHILRFYVAMLYIYIYLSRIFMWLFCLLLFVCFWHCLWYCMLILYLYSVSTVLVFLCSPHSFFIHIHPSVYIAHFLPCTFSTMHLFIFCIVHIFYWLVGLIWDTVTGGHMAAGVAHHRIRTRTRCYLLGLVCSFSLGEVRLF